jgi:TIR domain
MCLVTKRGNRNPTQGGAMNGEETAPQSPQPRLFVSHSSVDVELAREVTNSLRGKQIDAWLAADELTVGQNYAEVIYDEIRRADAVLVLLSRSALESAHVRREVNAAIEQRRVLLPVGLSPGLISSPDLPPDWRYWLGVVQIYPFESSRRLCLSIAQRLLSQQRPKSAQFKSSRAPAKEDDPSKRLRASLIQIGVEARPFHIAVQRCRHLRCSRERLESTALELRSAGLLEFTDPLTDNTIIRLMS